MEAVLLISDVYQSILAGQSKTILGGPGGIGSVLAGLLAVPASTSPGAITIQDGDLTAITVFAGGASSLSNLVPFFIPIGTKSRDGAWAITTGSNISVIALGQFL